MLAHSKYLVGINLLPTFTSSSLDISELRWDDHLSRVLKRFLHFVGLLQTIWSSAALPYPFLAWTLKKTDINSVSTINCYFTHRHFPTPPTLEICLCDGGIWGLIIGQWTSGLTRSCFLLHKGDSYPKSHWLLAPAASCVRTLGIATLCPPQEIVLLPA